MKQSPLPIVPHSARPLVAFLFLLSLLFAAIGFSTLSGCDSPEKYDPIIEQQKEKQKTDEAVKMRYAAEIQQLEEAKAKLAVELAKARAEAEDTAVLENRIEQVDAATRMKQAAAEQVQIDMAARKFAIIELEKLKAAAGDTGLQIGQGVQTASRFLPPPWDALAGLIGGAIIAGFSERRRVKTKEAAISAIGSMSMAAEAGAFEWTPELSSALNDSQTEAAKKLVAQADLYYDNALKVIKAGKKPVQAE